MVPLAGVAALAVTSADAPAHHHPYARSHPLPHPDFYPFSHGKSRVRLIPFKRDIE